MPLVKQNLAINFSGNIDTKTDPIQVDPHNFLSSNNMVRSTGGLLKKRNGFSNIASVSSPYSTALATFNGSLTAIGSSVQVYSKDTSAMVNRGVFQPVDISVLPAIRTAAGQTSVDVAIAPNGLACIVASDSSLGAVYQIIDSVSGAVIVPITVITASTTASPRVYLLGNYFFITFVVIVTATYHLKYIAVPYATPASPGAVTDIAVVVLLQAYEAAVYNNIIYLAWNSADNGGDSISIMSITSVLVQSAITVQNVQAPTSISVAVDSSGAHPVIWVSSLSTDTVDDYIMTSAFDYTLANTLANTLLLTTSATGETIISLTSLATAGVVTVYSDIGYLAPPTTGVSTNAILRSTCTAGGSVVSGVVIAIAQALASKAFVNPTNGVTYFLTVHKSAYQPTYFLVDGSTGIPVNILAKLAYSNASPATGNVLSSVNLTGSTIRVGYLFKDSISAVNKNVTGSVGGIYSTAGANIATFTLGSTKTITSEIGGSLQLSGGFLWQFDGQKPVEQGFHLYPDDLAASDGGGGNLTAQQYYYQACYEWTDAAGNTNRSAPSLPAGVLISGTKTVTVIVPTCRITVKVAPNKIRIVIYRWSTANPIFYQITSISSPTYNNNLVDYATYVDNVADSGIIGNNIIYTNGGVIENIAAPATSLMALFDTRLWLVDAEDPNLLWFSKQVIENTPVEMSDLFTVYVAPTTASQGSTGPTTALAPMDDKLIIFKANAAYYINGTGPDNTGANNQYSQPIFITSTIGCANQKSIVLTPSGLMFQTNQGIWLMDRALSVSYVGAAVESFNSNTVTSAVNIPGSTQVRFTLDSGTELIYDYFFQKWNTASSVPAIASVIYQGLHTYLDNAGNIFQETPAAYLDGSTPVCMSFSSPWYNLAGVSGYERAYFFYLLGTYISPHTLSVQVYYDYETINPSTATIFPNNYGSTHTLEEWRVFLVRQKCQAFKIVVTEVYDASLGVPAGAGLTLSGINLVVGVKKGYKPISTGNSTGAS